MIGFFGVFISDLDIGPTAMVNMIYILPEHRDNRNIKVLRYTRDLLAKMKERGIQYVEINAHPTHARKIERLTGLRPRAVRFFGKMEEWI